MRIQVEEWQLDTKARELHGPTGPVRLRPRALEALLLLVERAPAVVSKQDFLTEVWEAQAVSDSAIAQVIRELRSVLGDDPASPRFIATRHRQGYQWVATVRTRDEEGPETGPRSISASEPQRPGDTRSATAAADPASARQGWFLGIAAVVALLALLAVLWALSSGWSQSVDARGWPLEATARPHLERGLEAARRLDSTAALEHLGAALALDPTPRLAAEVARQQIRRGRVDTAAEILGRLRDERQGMARRDQLFADAVTAELEGRNTEAGRLFALLAETHPDDVDFALARWEHETDGEATSPLELVVADEIPADRHRLIAAQTAGRRGTPEDQQTHARALLDVAPGPSALVGWAHFEEGMALRSQGEIEASLSALARAAEIQRQLGELRAASHALALAVDTAAIRRDAETLGPLLRTYAELVETVGDPWEEARLAFLSGRLAVIEGHPTRAAELFEIAARRCEDLEAWNLGATALGSRGDALQELGELDAAGEVLRLAVRWAEASEHPSLVGQAAINLANYLSRRNELEAARVQYEKALERFRQASYLRGEAAALVNLARVARWQGNADRSVELNLAASELFESMELVRGEAVALFQAAEAELDLGDLAAAERLATQALDGFRSSRAVRFEALALTTLSEVARRSGDLGRAGDLLDPATVPLAEGLEARTRIERARARRARDLGEGELAHRALSAILTEHEAADDTAQGLHLQLDLARLDLDAGRLVVAEQSARRLEGHGERRSDQKLRRGAALVLARALVAQGRLDESSEHLVKVQGMLDAAPDFRDQRLLALAETQVETLRDQSAEGPRLLGDALEPSRVRSNVEARLRWVHDSADERGHRVLALEAQVELARRGLLDLWVVEDLRKELEGRGLGRLLAQLP